MNKTELVARTRSIRKDLLKLSQEDLARELGTSQAIVSRMEQLEKCTIDYLFCLFSFYEKKGIPIYMLWLPSFNVNALVPNSDYNNKAEIDKIITNLKSDLDTLATKFNEVVLL